MKNNIIELAKNLISFKTVTGNNKEIAACFEFIKEYFKPEIKQGKIIVREYEKNGVLSLVLANSNTLKFDIILNGHIDVVNAEDKDFIPSSKGGKLYARGAADMKSQVAVMMAILKEIANSDTKKTMALMLASDEEVGSKSGTGYLMKKIGYKAKVVVIPDGGENFELNIKEKGVFWIKIVSKGKPAHGSRPWLGENAILKLTKIYNDLEKKFPPLKKTKSLYQDGISLNLGKIQGGKSVNSIPDLAEMYLDFRYSEKSGREKILSVIKMLTKKHGLKFEIIEDSGASATDPKNQYLKTFKGITEEVTGEKMKITKSTGSSCLRFFAEKNIPVIITSPNYGNIHASGEWIEIKDIEKLYEILKKFLTKV